MIHELLSRPFKDSQIHWRVGATNKQKTMAMPLAYIDARDVMDRLDEVVGPGHWSDSYAETASGILICTLTIDYPGIGPVSKSDGAGQTDFEGEKGGISDAFKRAGVKHGIGRYLYGFGAQWVALDERGRLKETPKIPPEFSEQGYKASASRRIKREDMQQSLIRVLEGAELGDSLLIKETVNELNDREQGWIWALLSTKQKEVVRRLLGDKE